MMLIFSLLIQASGMSAAVAPDLIALKDTERNGLDFSAIARVADEMRTTLASTREVIRNLREK